MLPALSTVLASATSAFAHTGAPVTPDRIWSASVEEPWMLLVVGAAVWIYARGAGRAWRRAGEGRGLPRWRFWSYYGGIAILLVAVVSPLHALGGALFSAHMLQHELLIAAAAPLLVLGAPGLSFIWALPRAWRRPLGRWVARPTPRAAWRLLTHPLAAWTLHAAAVWLWHLPGPYQATLGSELVHTAQHISFFGTALLFWWPVLNPNRHRRLAPTGAVLYLFTTAAHGSALGALLTLAPTPWYPIYARGAAAWGFTALEDQQLGGLVMWVPFGALYTVAALAVIGFWLTKAGEGERARVATA